MRLKDETKLNTDYFRNFISFVARNVENLENSNGSTCSPVNVENEFNFTERLANSDYFWLFPQHFIPIITQKENCTERAS